MTYFLFHHLISTFYRVLLKVVGIELDGVDVDFFQGFFLIFVSKRNRISPGFLHGLPTKILKHRFVHKSFWDVFF